MGVTYNDEYDKILRNLVDNFPRSYFKKIRAKSNVYLLRYIEECTPMLSNEEYILSTKVFWVLNKLQDFPKCKICGRKIAKNVKINEGYPVHCSAKCLSDDPEVKFHKQESYQRKYGEGIINPFQAKEVISKIDKTNMDRYGVRRYTQTNEYRIRVSEMTEISNKKRHDTHKTNSSFNDSKPERVAFGLLRRKYNDLIWHYSSEKYPYVCDFYSPSEDVYIEFNGNWTHGGHYFNQEDHDDQKTLEIWMEKAKTAKYYSNAIYTWTELDRRKKDIAEKNKLNYVVFWNLSEIYNFVVPNYNHVLDSDELLIQYNRKVLDREFVFYRDYPKIESFNGFPSVRNEIVKFFQQSVFFKREREIWKNDPIKRLKLIANRVKYLNKDMDELTHCDILNGFKRSGMMYGYSHFNPLWFKWFIDRYNVKSCYDCCGGWGHRLLGGLSLDRYIYNDMSAGIKSNVDEMIRHFKIGNTVTYCQDARSFVPIENFDAMFTCPPYMNIERYECEPFADSSEYDDFVDSMFRVFETSMHCKIFGLVIREDLLNGHNDYSEKHRVNVSSQQKYLSSCKNKFEEYLYVFKKRI